MSIEDTCYSCQWSGDASNDIVPALKAVVQFMQLKNDNFIRALLRQPIDRRPVWVMRQAGRYLPEYLALRQQVPDFMTFCKTPELACEATMQPLARFDLDAAIIFSDILTIPEAMGLDLAFVKGEGPQFSNPVRTERAVQQLQPVDVEAQLGYVRDAIEMTAKEIDGRVPLIGFSGSPWTLATYMIEGQGSKIFLHPRAMAYQAPELLTQLLDQLTTVIIDYLNMQVRAGARALMVFDSWGGILAAPQFRQFSLAYFKRIADSVLREWEGQVIPLVFFSKDAGYMLNELANSGCDALGCDWKVNLTEARALVGDRVALQGNLDPAVMLAGPDVVRAEAQKVLEAYGAGTGHVFNLGHGIDKSTPVESMQALIECVHAFKV
jgi:uroporphyrinogen decarboxylase